ncbi:unnamed protein product [Cercopithifilaria johnstoni]|uniref:SXP/RAL-2 family protein Ani s 5-like cation-binding domain-containing protein n=1 Tax=Cercopithifilaria johnstoni TaxID=2874296 RepID=A0A8J2LXP4_9BILA|nr:unnamed protein product [Cercopithifilaria johnstoni]
MKAFIIANLLILLAIAQRQQPIVPPFLVGEPAAVVDQFQQLLVRAEQRTDKEVEQSIELWISRQSDKIQKAFKKFKEQVQNALRQAEREHQVAVSKLSPEARKIDAKLSSIALDGSLTPMQKQRQIVDIIKALPPNIKQELKRAMEG